MYIVLSAMCDREMARSTDAKVIATFLMQRQHALPHLEVWDNHPAHPGATGQPADQWLLNATLDDYDNHMPTCNHQHCLMMYTPYDHLLCLDCGKEVK